MDGIAQDDGGESKKNELIADLTFVYGIDAGGLPYERQMGLLANMDRVLAQERVRQQRYDPHDYRGIYNLWLAAYGDEERARAARLESLQLLVRDKCDEASRLSRKR